MLDVRRLPPGLPDQYTLCSISTNPSLPSHPTHPHAVTASGQKVTGPLATRVDYTRAALLHYVTKSEQDFKAKLARGNVMGDAAKGTELWDRVQQRCVGVCVGVGGGGGRGMYHR